MTNRECKKVTHKEESPIISDNKKKKKRKKGNVGEREFHHSPAKQSENL